MGWHVLGKLVRKQPVRKIRRSARALLLTDDDELVLFRRTVPGHDVYWATPGGKIDADDADAEAALRRELFEELGAEVGPVRHVLTATGPTPAGPSTQLFFVTRLISMDPTRRTGKEFHNPAKGSYDIELIPCTPKDLKTIRLVPVELAQFLAAHAHELKSS